LNDREKSVEKREGELTALIEEQRHKLEQISGLTVDQAKLELTRGIENEAKLEAAQIIKRIETEATELGNLKARKILGMAIQRMASDYVAENTVSVVDLPSEDMKGRIIGPKGATSAPSSSRPASTSSSTTPPRRSSSPASTPSAARSPASPSSVSCRMAASIPPASRSLSTRCGRSSIRSCSRRGRPRRSRTA